MVLTRIYLAEMMSARHRDRARTIDGRPVAQLAVDALAPAVGPIISRDRTGVIEGGGDLAKAERATNGFGGQAGIVRTVAELKPQQKARLSVVMPQLWRSPVVT